jgi:hypothetical protein
MNKINFDELTPFDRTSLLGSRLKEFGDKAYLLLNMQHHYVRKHKKTLKDPLPTFINLL